MRVQEIQEHIRRLRKSRKKRTVPCVKVAIYVSDAGQSCVPMCLSIERDLHLSPCTVSSAVMFYGQRTEKVHGRAADVWEEVHLSDWQLAYYRQENELRRGKLRSKSTYIQPGWTGSPVYSPFSHAYCPPLPQLFFKISENTLQEPSWSFSQWSLHCTDCTQVSCFHLGPCTVLTAPLKHLITEELGQAERESCRQTPVETYLKDISTHLGYKIT